MAAQRALIKKGKLMQFLMLILAIFAGLHVLHAQADWPVQEIRALPPYCAGRYARNDNMPEYKRWEAQYGPDFLHTHHLCDGIGMLNRYPKGRTDQEKRTLLNDAMGNLDYMVRNAKPDFGLMPDVYLYRSMAYSYAKHDAKAIMDILKAIELDPKLSRGYTMAADHYVKLNKKDEALKTVTEGLRHLPESKSLQRLYGELGGAQPYPEPYAPQVKVGGPAMAVEAVASTQATDGASQAKLDKNYALYDFSRHVGGLPATGYAGANVLLEITEDPAAPDSKVRLKITSMVPQPHARVGQIGIDMGRFTDIFVDIKSDTFLGKFFPVQRISSFTHPYWPNFTPEFLIRFTMDPKIAKPNDARSLGPGYALTMTATLGSNKRFEDVINALNQGVRTTDGLRFAIVGYHLFGEPLPQGTRMDDAGFYTGSIRKASGPHAQQVSKETTPKPEGLKLPAAAPMKPQDAATSAAPPVESTPPTDRIGSQSNPWCRFCPEPEKK